MASARNIDDSIDALNPRIAVAPSPDHIRRTSSYSMIEGAFTQTFMVWTTGSILTGWMLFLGAGPMALAAMASFPLLAQLVTPVTTWLSSGVGSRRKLMIYLAILGRGVWMLPVLLPLFPVEPPVMIGIMLAVLLFSSIFQTAAGPAWVSLMSDVIPEEGRGRYFGLRNGLMGVVGTVTLIGASIYIDHTAKPAAFQVVFLLAVLSAFVGIRMYGYHADPVWSARRLSLARTVREPFSDPSFRRFIFFSMYWNASVMLAAPFVLPYFFQHLHMSFTQLALWSGISALATLVTAPLWGLLADQVGHKRVLGITTLLAGTLHPLLWMLSWPGMLIFIWISSVMDALSWGGINAAMFNLSLAQAPRNRRMGYIAVLGAASGLAGFLAGTCSGILLPLLQKGTFVIGVFQWTGFHTLFLISAAFRSSAWLFLRSVEETSETTMRAALRFLWSRSMNRLPWK